MLLAAGAFAEVSDAPADVFTTEKDAALFLRSELKAHEPTICFRLVTDREASDEMTLEMFDVAVRHTGVPDEGTYLKLQVQGFACDLSCTETDAERYIDVTCHVTYMTTLEQEQQVNGAVASLMAELNLSGLSGEEKVSAIYQYIVGNVNYDNSHLNDQTYSLQYTAYAALINKTAVCQGYSMLFYRLALEAGLDARYVTGTANGDNHGWNIVEPEDDHVVIGQYTGSATKVTVPATIGGYPVTTLSRYAFDQNGIVEEIILPEGLTTIQNGDVDTVWYGRFTSAFHQCTSLRSISLPSTLRSITLPDGLESMYGTFDQCENLAFVSIPDSVTWIDNFTFRYTAIRGIRLPANLQVLGYQVFYRSDLKYAYIPGTIELADLGAFDDSTTIVGKSGSFAEQYAAEAGLPFLPVDRPTDNVVLLPAELTALGSEALAGTAAQIVIIPEGCTTVAADAFDRCESLHTVINLSPASVTAPDGVDVFNFS